MSLPIVRSKSHENMGLITRMPQNLNTDNKTLKNARTYINARSGFLYRRCSGKDFDQ